MENKKCAAGAATPNSALALQCGSSSCLNESISQQRPEGNSLIDLLPHGKSRAVSMKHLADVFGCTEREVRAMIHRARCDGSIICGDSNGYYLPETREELMRWYRLARKRSLSGLKALKAARQQLREMEGQQEMEGLS